MAINQVRKKERVWAPFCGPTKKGGKIAGNWPALVNSTFAQCLVNFLPELSYFKQPMQILMHLTAWFLLTICRNRLLSVITASS